ncbi:hypothetical protein ZWY2020_057836 [Hordeum vulgare]|nr:hypothetical protein ZWY2020_057836 [Hordeum vulgare]
MKLWVVLRRYGGAGMRAYVRRHVEMARWFEQALEADGRFEVAARGGERERRAFATHFVVDGKFVIRMAVGGAMTQMRHVQDTWELVHEKA